MTSTDREITLKFGRQSAVVAPLGASLRRYRVEGFPEGAWEVIWGYTGADQKKAGQGDVLIPFPSRVKDGQYKWGGKVLQMERNDKEGPNAIHGFLRTVTWESEPLGAAAARFTTELKPGQFAGYPFHLRVSLEYSLSEHGLKTHFEMKNVGADPAPVGAGFHPYFTVGKGPIDLWEAELPAVKYLEFEHLVPTGKVLSVEGTPLDYRRMKPVGASKFNFCFAELERGKDGRAVARLRNPRDGREVRIWTDEAFNYLVVYSGEAIPEPDRRRSFAIEPLTCATDAFNHPSWGLRVLAPQEVFRGSYGIETSAE